MLLLLLLLSVSMTLQAETCTTETLIETVENEIVISPDGRTVYVTRDDEAPGEMLLAWDAKTGEVIRVHTHPSDTDEVREMLPLFGLAPAGLLYRTSITNRTENGGAIRRQQLYLNGVPIPPELPINGIYHGIAADYPYLVFIADNAETDTRELYVMNVETDAEPRLLPTPAGRPSHPTLYSEADTLLLNYDGRDGFGIYHFTLSSGQLRSLDLGENSALIGSYALSPDGRTVVYQSSPGGQLYRASLDDSPAAQLTPGRKTVTSWVVDWTRETVIYTAQFDGTVYVAPLEPQQSRGLFTGGQPVVQEVYTFAGRGDLARLSVPSLEGDNALIRYSPNDGNWQHVYLDVSNNFAVSSRMYVADAIFAEYDLSHIFSMPGPQTSPDGRFTIIHGRDGTTEQRLLYRYDNTTGDLIQIPGGEPKGVSSGAYSSGWVGDAIVWTRDGDDDAGDALVITRCSS